MVRIFSHPSARRHDPGPEHPESPQRIIAIQQALRCCDALEAEWVDAPVASEEDVLRVHSFDHLRRLRAMGRAGGGMFDGDTIMGPHSLEAILRSAGAAVDAAESALEGTPAFSAMRPPGHHASAERAMGFCFLNNIVVAARAMIARRHLERILLVDWDVHHGNGTQNLVESDPRIRYVSLHQHPHYPGTGAESETGVGNIFNVPRPPGLPASRYVADLQAVVESACENWEPQLMLISAGFDGLAGDPLGGFTFEAEDFGNLTSGWVKRGLPVASVLEGGYNPHRTAVAVLAHTIALGLRPE